MLDENEIHRLQLARRMAHKLAHNKSRNRTVRKLPQSMVIVPMHGVRRAYPGREVLLRNKRMAYILLLGAVMCAYLYDVDQETLQNMLTMVNLETHKHIGGFLGRT